MDADTARQWVAGRWRRVKGRMRTAWKPHMLYLSGGLGMRVLNEDAWESAIDAFGRWCAQNEGQACMVGLCGHSILTSLSEPGTDASHAREQALRHWAHYQDLDQAAIQAHWTLRQLHGPQAKLLCGAPTALINGLRSRAALHGVRIDWLGPWWARGLEAWVQSLMKSLPEGCNESLLLLKEPGLVTCMQARISARRADEIEEDGRVSRAPALDEGVPVLHRVWSEVADGSPFAHDAGVRIVELPLSVQDQPEQAGVWAGGEIAEILQGRHFRWWAEA